MSRSLEVRVREYIDHGLRTSDKLITIADTMDERFPQEAQTAELRTTAKVMRLVAGDLEKVLNGEELSGWKIEGILPND